MANNSAHQHGPLWHWLPWNWQAQAEQHTDETPVVQPAGGFRIIHQDEARRQHNRFLAWCDEQPELHPRYADEKTGPKSRYQLGHLQQIAPQFAAYQPPQGTPHNGMQRLSAPNTPIPETPKQQQQALTPPPWMQQLRDGSLLIPCQGSAIDEPKDANLMTMVPAHGATPSTGLPKIDINGDTLASIKRRSQPLIEKMPIDQLPTAHSLDRMTQDALASLPPFIGGGEMPEVDQQPFPEHSWLYGDLRLDPMASGEIAAVDKTASYTPPRAWDELEMLASQPAKDDTLEVPVFVKKQHEKKGGE